MNTFGYYANRFESLEKAADFIKPFEGFAGEAYVCPAGKLTIGFGHTEGVKPGDKITREAAEKLLIEDLRPRARRLARYITAEVTENQFVALLSLAYNVGALQKKCPKLLRALNQGDDIAAAKEFLDVDKVNGKAVPGLTRRRHAESSLFLGGYE